MRTDRWASSATRPLSPVPLRWWRRGTLAVAPHRKRCGPSGALPSQSRIDAMGLGGLFIEPDEVTQRHRIRDVFRFRERIESQCLFEPSHQDGDAERVEPRIEQDQVIGQGRQTLRVVLRNPLNLRNHGGLDERAFFPRVHCTLVLTTMLWISVRRSSTPSNSSCSGKGCASAISASSARKSSWVWVTSQTPWTSVYSISAEPWRWARSARWDMNRWM